MPANHSKSAWSIFFRAIRLPLSLRILFVEFAVSATTFSSFCLPVSIAPVNFVSRIPNGFCDARAIQSYAIFIRCQADTVHLLIIRFRTPVELFHDFSNVIIFFFFDSSPLNRFSHAILIVLRPRARTRSPCSLRPVSVDSGTADFRTHRHPGIPSTRFCIHFEFDSDTVIARVMLSSFCRWKSTFRVIRYTAHHYTIIY